MKPGEFCLENAIEMLPDDYRRKLGAEARIAAETDKDLKPIDIPGYWGQVLSYHAALIQGDAYGRRQARLSRK